MQLENAVYGPRSEPNRGLTTRVVNIENYIQKQEEREAEDRKERRKVVYGIYSALFIMVHQLVFTLAFAKLGAG